MKAEGISKDDWWVGFGRWFWDTENEVIYSVKPINIFMEEGGKCAKESNEYNY